MYLNVAENIENCLQMSAVHFTDIHMRQTKLILTVTVLKPECRLLLYITLNYWVIKILISMIFLSCFFSSYHPFY